MKIACACNLKPATFEFGNNLNSVVKQKSKNLAGQSINFVGKSFFSIQDIYFEDISRYLIRNVGLNFDDYN